MTKIWQRYILLEFLKVFSFFLFGFYFLYVVIDYSTHMQDFLIGKNLSLLKIAKFYGLQFVKRMDILLPISLLIGAIKLLCGLNLNRELLALQSAGLKIKTLLTPLFLIGVLCTLVNLSVSEFVAPYSLNFIDKFHDAHLRHSHRGNRTEPLSVIHLDDHSKLIYKHYDAAKEAFFDVIWLRDSNDIWRMKYLKADPTHPEGEWVDHLERGEDASFEKTASYSNLVFRDLHWNKELPRRGFIPFENRAISELYTMLKSDSNLTVYERHEVLTQLLFKLIMPSLSLLVLFAICPYCYSYSKTLPQFFIYGIGLFGLLAFIAFMDASVILGESNTIPPYVAILSPFILLLSIFGWRFAKT